MKDNNIRYILQLNGSFICVTNPRSPMFKKPQQFTKEHMMGIIDGLDFEKGETINVFVVDTSDYFLKETKCLVNQNKETEVALSKL